MIEDGELKEVEIHGLKWKAGDHIKGYGVIEKLEFKDGWWYADYKNRFGHYKISMDDKKIKTNP